MLVAAARKELGGTPIRLNFEYPAIPEVQRIVEKVAESFRAAGVEIATAEVLPSRLEAELRAGRRFDLAYRVMRCDEPVFDAGISIAVPILQTSAVVTADLPPWKLSRTATA